MDIAMGTLIIIVAVLLMLLIIANMVDAWYTTWKFHRAMYAVEGKNEKAKEKLPHEIFPDLLYWKKDDNLFGHINYIYKWKFVAVLDGLVWIKHTDPLEVVSLTPQEAAKKLSNMDYKKRAALQQLALLEVKIETDHYNEFMRVLRENETQAFEVWKTRQLEGINDNQL